MDLEKKSPDIVLVCGNHTNAHTIVRNLPLIGFEGETIIVRNETDPVLVADRLNPKVRQWVLSAEQACNFPETIAKRWAGQDCNIYACFTNERYHHSFARWKREHPDDNIIVHFGNFDCISTILDRYQLYRFIEKRNLAAVPQTIAGTDNPFEVFGDTFVVRPRESFFWMQHGLLEWISGHAILSRYLGKEPIPVSREQAETKYWVNTVQCLYRALKFSFKPLGYYYRKNSWAPYSLFQAMWYAPLHVFSKIRAGKWTKLAKR